MPMHTAWKSVIAIIYFEHIPLRHEYVYFKYEL
jgi:hypothetical protein